MKIAILTSGILPVPAVQGGAVENLIDFYLDYNDRHPLHDITVYSVWHPKVKKHPAMKSKVNHYVYFRTNGWWAKIMKYIYLKKHGREYYHYSIEYYLEQTIKHIKRHHYDLIIFENRPGYVLKLKDISKAQFIYHLHNEKLDIKAKRAEEIYNAAARIITVSDYIANCVRSINQQDTKCITVHNGINLSDFKSDESYPKKSLFEPEDFVLVFSGRINKEKGIMELIEALYLLKDHPNIKLLVIGSSFYGNVKNENRFEKVLKEKAIPLKDRILFTGFVPYSEIPFYLRMSDIAVIPSVWDDPFPTTVLEAQAMGLPIITTRRGGIPEEVTKKNAVLLDTNEHFIEDLAFAILDLYEHQEKRIAMAEASLERSTLFNKEAYAKNFFKAIENGMQ